MPASKSPVSIAALAAMSSTVAREAEAGNALKNASACSFLACGSRSPTKACSACLSRGSWISPKTVCCDAWPRYRTVSTSCGRAFPHSRAISAAKARIDLSCLMGQRVLGLKDAQDLFMPRRRCSRPSACVPLAGFPTDRHGPASVLGHWGRLECKRCFAFREAGSDSPHLDLGLADSHAPSEHLGLPHVERGVEDY